MSIQQEKINAIKRKIWDKLPNPQPMSGNDIPDKIDDVYKQGKTDEHKKMWDRLQYYDGIEDSNKSQQQYRFYGACWGWDNFYPTKDVVIRGRGDYSFYNFATYENAAQSLIDRFNECGVKLDTSKQTGCAYMFAYVFISEIPTLDFRNITVTSTGVFLDNWARLKKIELIKVSKTLTYSDWFRNDTRLTYIRFEGEIGNSMDLGACPLDKESLISTITHLCADEDVVGQKVIFKKSAVNNAFGIDVDDATTYPVGSEYYELRRSKPNWDFLYVE